jgi:hypothetical protein
MGENLIGNRGTISQTARQWLARAAEVIKEFLFC